MSSAGTPKATVTSEIPVLISGAGPTGLLAGVLLRKMNIPVRIIERDPRPSPLSKAVSIHARTQEIFQLTDPALIKSFVDEGNYWRNLHIYLGGQLAHNITAVDTPETQFKLMLMLEQNRTVKILSETFERLGGRFDRGWELMDTRVVETEEQGSSGSWVETRIRKALVGTNLRAGESRFMSTTEIVDEDEDKEYEYETVKSQFLIGADGGRSTVRHKVHIPFEGRTRMNSLILFDGFLDTDMDTDMVSFVCGNIYRTIAVFPLNEKNRVRIIFDNGTRTEEEFEAQKSTSLTQEQFQEMLDEVALPIRIKVTKVNWLTYYRVNERRAKEYIHKSRIFLAGDAAHVHSPAGGQGMNTGLQDSYNLAWKIAMVVNGTAPLSLLNSYQEERPAIADEIIATSSRQLDVGVGHDFLKRVGIRVLLSLVTLLKPLLAKRPPSMSMLGLRYYPNSLNKTHKTQSAPTGPGAIGRRAGDAEVYPYGRNSDPVAVGNVNKDTDKGEVRVYELMVVPGAFQILVFTGKQWERLAEAADEMATIMERHLANWRSRWPSDTNDKEAAATRLQFMVHTFTTITAPFETKEGTAHVLSQKKIGEGKAYVDVDEVLHGRYGVDTKLSPTQHPLSGGAIVVVRPDTHIAYRVQGVGENAWSDVNEYFNSILV